MWLDNLKELRNRTGLSDGEIAKKSMLSEKTVDRVFSGHAKTPYVDTLYRIVKALGGSLDDILAESKVVVGTEKLATLQDEVDITSAELDMLTAENNILKDKVVALTAEVDLLKMQLAHKEEIISIHNYYNKRLSTND
jgi:transcriptional regulator with XRE-family HTH domain